MTRTTLHHRVTRLQGHQTATTVKVTAEDIQRAHDDLMARLAALARGERLPARPMPERTPQEQAVLDQMIARIARIREAQDLYPHVRP
jgi:hypothetical protein